MLNLKKGDKFYLQKVLKKANLDHQNLYSALRFPIKTMTFFLNKKIVIN